MRHKYEGVWWDGQFKVIASGTITVYLAGGTTLATVYVSETGAVLSGSQTTTDNNGRFSFWVSDSDYNNTQKFKFTGVKAGFTSVTYDDLAIIPSSASNIETLRYKTLALPQIHDTSEDHQYIFAVSELTADRTITLPLLTASSTFAFINFAQVWSALQTFNQGMIRFGDTSDDHYYILGVSELAANRTITLPLLDGNDTFVFNNFAATLLGKTLITPTIASFVNANHDHSNAAGGGYKIGMIQRVVDTVSSAATGTLVSGTTAIPYDDTIPQNTEGDQYLTVTITPKNSAHNLVIEVILYCSHTVASDELIGALFKDSIVNALAATIVIFHSTNEKMKAIVLKYEMTAGTTSATTFNFRAGSSTGATMYVNGTGAGRKFGGVLKSYMRVTEEKLS